MSPKITPSYWICPRCDERDNYYYAPRVVGQVGLARGFEIGDVEFAGGGAQSVEKEVALCKKCGERVKFVAEVVEYSPEEARVRDRQEMKSGFLATILMGIISYFVGDHYINMPEESTIWLIGAVATSSMTFFLLIYTVNSAFKSIK